VFFLTVIFILFENVNSQDFIVRSEIISSVNSSVIQENVWSVFNNQACLGNIEEINVGTSWENRFLLQELSIQKLAVTYPLSFGTTAISFARFGFEKYNENSIGMAFGRKLGERFSIGLKFSYLWRFIGDNYDRKGIFLLELGLFSKPLDGIIVGFHLFNPLFSGFNDFSKSLKSATYRLGVGFDKYPNFYTELEVSGNIYYPLCLKFKLEFMVLENISLLTGMQTSPVGNSFGLGFYINKLRIDIGFCTHQVLGLSPRICLSYGL
jgi:hypothetical protein